MRRTIAVLAVIATFALAGPVQADTTSGTAQCNPGKDLVIHFYSTGDATYVKLEGRGTKGTFSFKTAVAKWERFSVVSNGSPIKYTVSGIGHPVGTAYANCK